MPSVVGLLEQRELTARRRMDELREEADRIHAELAVVEREWNEWVIARSRVGEVLAPDGAGPDAGEDLADRGLPLAAPGSLGAAKSKSMVQMWRAGLALSVLSVDYQPILQALTHRQRPGQGPPTLPGRAAPFGLGPGPGNGRRAGQHAGRGTSRRARQCAAGRCRYGNAHCRRWP